MATPVTRTPTAPESAEVPALRLAVAIDPDDARRTLAAAGAEFARLVSQIPSPATPTRDLKWTAVETAVHTMTALRYYRQCIEEEIQPERVDDLVAASVAQNDRLITEEPERDPRALSSRLTTELESLIGATRGAGEMIQTRYYAIQREAAICNLLSEFLIHGRDIARSIGRPWRIDPHAARLAVYCTSATLPLVSDPEAIGDLDAVVNIRVRGGSCFAIRLRDKRATTETCVGRPDLVMWVDPVAYLLVGFGRVGQWGPILRGQLLAWGRRPSLSIKLAKLFRNP